LKDSGVESSSLGNKQQKAALLATSNK